MATHKPAPLRDRLLSNSPDPIKSSILRESGAGWASLSTNSIHSSTSGTITSPLRIAKRDSPVIPRGANVARRSSSSFKHVRDNNLVTNSPFKIQGPSLSTPSRPTSVVFPTRRVSGEKRPRPLSMHEDAENENDRPTALKRDRKQSRVFQGLLEKEPVTRSPFKQFERMGGMDGAPPSPPPIPKIPYLSNPTPIAAIASRLTPISREPSPPANGPSPGRSSLVSRRLHGPRLSGGGKRERRKTVTFDERCDVVEFDRDTSDEEYWEGSEDGERYGEPYQDAEEGDPFFRGDEMTDEPPRSELQAQIAQLAPHATLDEDSYESAHISDTDRATTTTTLLDTDTSITGLVEEMFFSSNAALINADAIGSSTPSRISDIPTDLETEDGIPFGRSHHAERLLQHHQQESPQRSQPPPRFSPHVSPHSSHASAHQSPQIGKMADFSGSFSRGSPDQCGHPMTPPHIPVVPAQSTPPLGRLTHLERAMKAREEEKGQMEEVGADAEKLPISPSPVRSTSTPPTRSEGLIPKYKWPRGAQHGERRSPSVGADPFEIHERSHEDNHRASTDSLDPRNLSIGNSEVSLSGLQRNDVYQSSNESPPESVLDSSPFLKDESQEERSRQDQSMSISLAAPDVSREARQEIVQEEEEEILAGINDHDSTRLSVNPSPRLEIPPRFASSSIPVTSPLNLSQSSNSPRAMSPRPNVRHRISKDNIRRRLTERRSSPSPSPEPNSQFDAVMERIESYPTPEVQFGKTEGPDPQEVIVPHFEEPEVQAPEHDKERDRMSIFSALTDVSIETATVQRAEKFNVAGGLPTPDSLSETEFGMPEASTSLQLNLGNKFSLGGMGLARSNSIVHSKEALSVPSQGHEVDAGSVHSGTSGTSVKVGDMDVNMDMKSALDRLMDDVAGAGSHEEDSMMTDEYDKSQDQSLETTRPPKVQRTATDSDLLHTSGLSGRFASGSSIDSIPPPPPPKDNNIKAREQLILEKRREARRAEEGGFVPRRGKGQRLQAQLGLGRPTRRRSMSAGDAQDLAKRQLLSVGGDMEQLVEEDLLSHSIERELRKLDRENSGKKSKYHVREREGTIYASASDDKVSHMDGAGDLETGRAWRTVRRPSDMNEYSKQIKEYRSQANPTKAYGKVFVKVLGIKGVRLPLPQEPTALTCTLNNGIHFVTTPECELGLDCRIDQEFELIEHSKLEFTLTLKVRRDPHIVSQFKALAPTPAPPPPPPPVVQQSTSRGMRAFFSSSPKKHSKDKAAHQPPPPPPIHRLPENLARYLKPDGTLARAFIQFKDIATKCDTRLFETSYPLIGQRVELGGKFSTLQVGEIVLQIFRLPPLPGIPPDQLPQSLEECHRGLRHINWHKVTYFEGILTQNGGDCNTWRRRLFRVIGANLVAFNDVTRKATATIDLKKAIAVQDDQDIRNPLSPLARSRGYDDDALFGVERSFRLIFPQDQEIIFFADTDEEKFRWLEVLRALVGHIPPHPLWAELLWQRQEEASKRTDKSVDQSSMPAAQGTPSSRQR